MTGSPTAARVILMTLPHKSLEGSSSRPLLDTVQRQPDRKLRRAWLRHHVHIAGSDVAEIRARASRFRQHARLIGDELTASKLLEVADDLAFLAPRME